MSLIVRFLRDNRAATSIEYAMIGGLISIMIVVGVRTIGLNIQAKFFGPLASNLT